MSLSRRAFVTAAGGGLLAAAAASLVWKFGGTDAPADPPGQAAPEAVVDWEGWMLTPAEQDQVPREELAVETQ